MKGCQLYRYFDSDGILLYVGISLSAIGRMVAHSRSDSVVKIEWHPSREAALAAEAAAIRTENPIFNKLLRSYRIEDAIARLRATQPDNDDVMTLCDALEASIIAGNVAKHMPSVPSVGDATGECQECERRREQTAARVRKARASKKMSSGPAGNPGQVGWMGLRQGEEP